MTYPRNLREALSNEPRTFRITVRDKFDGAEYTGEFVAEDGFAAATKALIDYAIELDCFTTDLEIANSEEI